MNDPIDEIKTCNPNFHKTYRHSGNTHTHFDFSPIEEHISCLQYIYIYIYGYGSKNPLDRPAVIRTSGTRGLRKGA